MSGESRWRCPLSMTARRVIGLAERCLAGRAKQPSPAFRTGRIIPISLIILIRTSGRTGFSSPPRLLSLHHQPDRNSSDPHQASGCSEATEDQWLPQCKKSRQTCRRIARHESVDPAVVRHRQRHGSAGLFQARRTRARPRSGLSLRPADHARHPRRLRPQPPRHRHRLSRHRQVDAYRAGGGAAQLALRARQPRQPHQPHRPDRQGRHRHQGRPAGHRIPRRHSALGAPAQRRALLRRIRRRPPGRDVRDPARARSVGPPDAARPEHA